MQLLFVLMTGDAWTDTLGEMTDEAPSGSARAAVVRVVAVLET